MAESSQSPRPVHAVTPRVKLVAWTRDPYGLAVASAKTCYASDFVFVGSLGKKGERQRITLQQALPAHAAELAEIALAETPHHRRVELATRLGALAPDEATRYAVAEFADLARRTAESNAKLAHAIYEAGHHTPFQHPTFVFALEGVSRNVVESFLHNHTFYNSEQQSQRYVEMGEARVVVPDSVAANAEARQVFDEAVRGAWDAYHDLREQLSTRTTKVMSAIGKLKGQSDKKVEAEAEKKAQEMARYVIPIAAQTQLYHTVSGIVLLRYLRMCEATTVASEAREVVARMVDEVRKVDAAFLAEAKEEPRPRGAHPDWRLVEGAQPGAHATAGTWPRDGNAHARLVRVTSEAEALVLAAVREVTGTQMPAPALLREVLDPKSNPDWNDTLNTWDHSPVLRALRHVHYTFEKRLSLSAHAQDQRHRMTPGSRPLLQQCLTPVPDVFTPDIIASDPAVKARFDGAIAALWSAMAALERLGIPPEDRTYLLPNATNIRFTQSGDLLSLIHKWRLRLCFNAQKEIFDASMEELRQAQAATPSLTRFVGPPCTFVSAAVPASQQDSVEACCPEASWCGVKVWKSFDAAKGTPKRPY